MNKTGTSGFPSAAFPVSDTENKLFLPSVSAEFSGKSAFCIHEGILGCNELYECNLPLFLK